MKVSNPQIMLIMPSITRLLSREIIINL